MKSTKIAVVMDVKRESNQPHLVRVKLRNPESAADGAYIQYQRLSSLNVNYMPMAYPLMFMYGDPGWTPEAIAKRNETLLKHAKYFWHLGDARRTLGN
ncbi:hypothetical protein BC940DRAFT_328546 [Gongronella butleri]|nr:hypothetical protein BC940DRAFT_328546 [Gongronella butleri]